MGSKTRGGALVATATAVILLMTVGVGVAFGAEGIGGFVGEILKAPSLIFAEGVGDGPHPTLSISWNDGGNAAGRQGIGTATAYPIDGNGDRGTGHSVTLTGEGDVWTIELNDLPEIDNEEVFGYEFDMPSPSDYELMNNGYYDDGAGHYVYMFNYDYSPSPSGLKPAMMILWEDSGNEGERPSPGEWAIWGQDAYQTMIPETYTSFTPSGVGDAWAVEFDDLPSYGSDGVADTADAYQFSWGSISDYHVETRLPVIENGYYYKTFALVYDAPVARANPTFQLTWNDEGNAENRPASITVYLRDGETELESYTLTGEGNVWSHTFTGYPAERNGQIARYEFSTDITSPYYEGGGYWWQTEGSIVNDQWVDGDWVYCSDAFYEGAAGPGEVETVPHTNPGIIVWWWDEWEGVERPESLSVYLYDGDTLVDQTTLTGSTDPTTYTPWWHTFTGHEEAQDEYRFVVSVPNDFEVEGYDIEPARSLWAERDSSFDNDPYDPIGSGWFDQWRLDLVPEGSPATIETTSFTMTRTDPANSSLSGQSVQMEIEETLPLAVDSIEPTDYPMSVVDSTSTPKASVNPVLDDSDTPLTLTYTPTLADGDTITVDLVQGSTVRMRKTGSSPSVSKTSGTGTEGDGYITFSVGSGALPPTVIAAAEETPSQGPAQGTITINSVSNASATYDAYKVFGANVHNDGTNDIASAIDWSSTAARNTVLAFLADWDIDGTAGSDYDAFLATRYGSPATDEMRQNPQNAAEFIAAQIGSSAIDTTANTTPPTTVSDSFATQLALALRSTDLDNDGNADLSPTATITAGTAYTGDQGYWLIATTASTIGAGESGTAPIWTAISDTPKTINEKTSVPTFAKQVKDNTDDATNYAKVADASIGQDLDFRLSTVLPSNVDSFASYSVSVADALPAGMELSSIDDVAVFLAGVDITDLLDGATTGDKDQVLGSISYANNVLTVVIGDVKDDFDSEVDVLTDKSLVITYKAHLLEGANAVDENIEFGSGEGNQGGATLTYSADPMSPEATSTLTSSAQVLTYQVQLDKVDAATRLPLNGAGFTVKTTIDNTDYYVQQNGSLGANPYEFTTSNGTLTISGIDEGVYTLHESTAPTDYSALASDVVLTVDAVKNGTTGELTSLTATAQGGNGTFQSNPTSAQDGIVSATPATGLVNLRVSDMRQIVMPLTGLPIDTAWTIAGVSIAVVSLIAYVASKRRDDEE